MTVIYVDVLFTLNTLVNFLLLSLTARLSGTVFSYGRLILGAALGGLFSILLFFAPNGIAYGVIFKVLLCCGVVSGAFGKRNLRDFCRLAVIFCLVTFALGGVVFVLSTLGLGNGQMSNGVIYYDISYITLIFGSLLTYGILSLIMGHGGLCKTAELCQIKIRLQDKDIAFSAMYDSGNCLFEPVTKKKVILASPSIFQGLLPQDITAAEGLRIYAVPYKTASGSGLIYAFQADGLWVNNVEHTDYLIGIAETEITGKQNTTAIIGGLSC